MDFATPLALLLLALPALVWRLPTAGRADGAALSVPEGLARRLGLAAERGDGPLGGQWLALAIWACLVVALAGPRQLSAGEALPVSGRDLVLALDLSGSMSRQDFSLNGRDIARLDAVKHVGSRFVRGRGGDRLALVIYGTTAYFAVPQTFDVEAVAEAIEASELGVVGRATNIGDAIGLATKRLRDSPADSRVIVLLSDGVSNAGPVKPRDAAALARQNGIRIHTIALGPRDLTNADGERDAVDSATLQAIAELSGGTAFRVKTTSDLANVADAIDRLETTAADGARALTHRALWIWPAGAALALALMAAAAEARR